MDQTLDSKALASAKNFRNRLIVCVVCDRASYTWPSSATRLREGNGARSFRSSQEGGGR